MSEIAKRRLIVECTQSRHHFDAIGYTVQTDGCLDIWADQGTAAASFAPGWVGVYYEDARPPREAPAA